MDFPQVARFVPVQTGPAALRLDTPSVDHRLRPRLVVTPSRKSGGYVPLENAGDSLVEFASGYNATHSPRVDYFVFGHQHVLLQRPLPEGGEVVILGDWISKFTYAVWDKKCLKTHVFDAKN